MTLLALWHVLQVRRPDTALPCNGVTEYYGSNADDENEFKTGKHTYARWNNGGDMNKDVTEDELVDVEEIDEYDVTAVTDDDGDDDEEDEVDDDDDNDDENNSDNPLLDALKKVYSAVFFYGLEEPAPNPLYRNKVSRMNRSNQRKAIPSGRKLKSPFFTKGEQKAYYLLLNDKEYPLDVESKDRSPPFESNSDSPFMDDEAVYEQDVGSVSTREYPEKNNELDDLDKQLRSYSEQLKSLDRKIKDIQTGSPSDEKLSALQSQRDQITSVIEDIQIRYVTVKSLRSE